MQVQHLREVNQAQGRQLASARAHMEAQAVAAAAQHQQAGFRLCLCPACACSIPSLTCIQWHGEC